MRCRSPMAGIHEEAMGGPRWRRHRQAWCERLCDKSFWFVYVPLSFSLPHVGLCYYYLSSVCRALAFACRCSTAKVHGINCSDWYACTPACLHALQLDSTRTVTDEARFLGTLVRCTDQAQLKVAEGFQPGMFIPGISRRSREPWPASSTAWRLDFGCAVQPMGGSVLDAFLGGRWSYVFRKSR